MSAHTLGQNSWSWSRRPTGLQAPLTSPFIIDRIRQRTGPSYAQRYRAQGRTRRRFKMFISYVIILILSQLISVLLRGWGFRHYLLTGFLIFLIVSIGFTLCVHRNLIDEPFLTSSPEQSRVDTGR
jgi:hypothetical protein